MSGCLGCWEELLCFLLKKWRYLLGGIKIKRGDLGISEEVGNSIEGHYVFFMGTKKMSPTPCNCVNVRVDNYMKPLDHKTMKNEGFQPPIYGL